MPFLLCGHRATVRAIPSLPRLISSAGTVRSLSSCVGRARIARLVSALTLTTRSRAAIRFADHRPGLEADEKWRAVDDRSLAGLRFRDREPAFERKNHIDDPRGSTRCRQ